MKVTRERTEVAQLKSIFVLQNVYKLLILFSLIAINHKFSKLLNSARLLEATSAYFCHKKIACYVNHVFKKGFHVIWCYRTLTTDILSYNVIRRGCQVMSLKNDVLS